MNVQGFIWNPSNYECECDKLCDIGEYLDYKNCKCRNGIAGKLVEECTKIVDVNKIYNEALNTISSNDSLSDCVSCTSYIALFALLLVTSVLIDSVFIYFHCYLKDSNDQLCLKKDNVRIKFSPRTEKTIYLMQFC